MQWYCFSTYSSNGFVHLHQITVDLRAPQLMEQCKCSMDNFCTMITHILQTLTENEEIGMMLMNPFRASDCVEYVTPSLVEGRAFLVEDIPLIQ